MDLLSLEVSESELKRAETNLSIMGYVKKLGLGDIGVFEYQCHPCFLESGLGQKTNVQGEKTHNLKIHHPGGLTLSDVLP